MNDNKYDIPNGRYNDYLISVWFEQYYKWRRILDRQTMDGTVFKFLESRVHYMSQPNLFSYELQEHEIYKSFLKREYPELHKYITKLELL